MFPLFLFPFSTNLSTVVSNLRHDAAGETNGKKRRLLIFYNSMAFFEKYNFSRINNVGMLIDNYKNANVYNTVAVRNLCHF